MQTSIKHVLLALVTAALGAGCLRSTTFTCAEDGDCGGGGKCEVSEGNYCSFSDSSCPVTMRRFGDSAGPKANRCVGEVEPDIDAGMADGPLPVDAGRCKASYTTLPSSGPRGHVYRLLPGMATWAAQRDACVADMAFLAFPDGATLADAQAELAALTTLAGNGVWLGLNDLVTNDQFRTTQSNMPASAITLMLFAAGEPDDNPSSGGGSAECVVGAGMTMTDDKCDAPQRKAVCECVP